MEDQYQIMMERIVRPIVINAVMDAIEGLGLDPKKMTVANGEKYEQGVQIACEELNTKPQTVYSNIDKIPHRKLHGKLYFNRQELQAYIRNEGVKSSKSN